MVRDRFAGEVMEGRKGDRLECHLSPGSACRRGRACGDKGCAPARPASHGSTPSKLFIPHFRVFVRVFTFYGHAMPDARERIPTSRYADTILSRTLGCGMLAVTAHAKIRLGLMTGEILDLT
jgi:hypothetical protein